MQKYINQLLTDIAYATENVSWPYTEKELNLWDWMPDNEEDKTAPELVAGIIFVIHILVFSSSNLSS